MPVSVVIPVKDDERVFACVESVLRCAGDGLLEVLVADNGSDAGLRTRLEGLPPPVRLLHEPEPGSDRARARAFREAAGDLIFCIDADCVAKPGWVKAGLEGFSTGPDVLQGYSGSVGRSRADRLIQARYEAHLRRLRPGDPVEADTRNLAFRRAVLDRVVYPASPRRTGDTEFGLLAEAAGLRVAYWPSMRVDHAHDPRLAVFLAKQACHGWGAQRIMRERPGARWHSGHLRMMAALSRRRWRPPGGSVVGSLLVRAAVGAGRVLDYVGPGRLPYRPALWSLAALDKLAGLGGHLLYGPGGREPLASDFLGERLKRD